ncbi:hypothetical protein B0A49_03955 [Cryomyces minteri]|uniref:Uncharacterized protein n=1 Tax=Cryomyces minteri TaxID=331657 RepID=A0A4U0XKS7_9PEZI|nr:hypothetical protein B0A49_03955 [Cryomyces minteri]
MKTPISEKAFAMPAGSVLNISRRQDSLFKQLNPNLFISSSMSTSALSAENSTSAIETATLTTPPTSMRRSVVDPSVPPAIPPKSGARRMCSELAITTAVESQRSIDSSPLKSPTLQRALEQAISEDTDGLADRVSRETCASQSNPGTNATTKLLDVSEKNRMDKINTMRHGLASSDSGSDGSTCARRLSNDSEASTVILPPQFSKSGKMLIGKYRLPDEVAPQTDGLTMGWFPSHIADGPSGHPELGDEDYDGLQEPSVGSNSDASVVDAAAEVEGSAPGLGVIAKGKRPMVESPESATLFQPAHSATLLAMRREDSVLSEHYNSHDVAALAFHGLTVDGAPAEIAQLTRQKLLKSSEVDFPDPGPSARVHGQGVMGARARAIERGLDWAQYTNHEVIFGDSTRQASANLLDLPRFVTFASGSCCPITEKESQSKSGCRADYDPQDEEDYKNWASEQPDREMWLSFDGVHRPAPGARRFETSDDVHTPDHSANTPSKSEPTALTLPPLRRTKQLQTFLGMREGQSADSSSSANKKLAEGVKNFFTSLKRTLTGRGDDVARSDNTTAALGVQLNVRPEQHEEQSARARHSSIRDSDNYTESLSLKGPRQLRQAAKSKFVFVSDTASAAHPNERPRAARSISGKFLAPARSSSRTRLNLEIIEAAGMIRHSAKYDGDSTFESVKPEARSSGLVSQRSAQTVSCKPNRELRASPTLAKADDELFSDIARSSSSTLRAQPDPIFHNQRAETTGCVSNEGHPPPLRVAKNFNSARTSTLKRLRNAVDGMTALYESHTAIDDMIEIMQDRSLSDTDIDALAAALHAAEIAEMQSKHPTGREPHAGAQGDSSTRERDMREPAEGAVIASTSPLPRAKGPTAAASFSHDATTNRAIEGQRDGTTPTRTVTPIVDTFLDPSAQGGGMVWRLRSEPAESLTPSPATVVGSATLAERRGRKELSVVIL